MNIKSILFKFWFKFLVIIIFLLYGSLGYSEIKKNINYSKKINAIIFSANLSEKSSTSDLVNKIKDSSTKKRVNINEIYLKNYITGPINTDLIKKDGIPEKIKELHNIIKEVDAIIIVSPEYNGFFPGHLKTTLDFLSLLDEDFIKAKPILISSISSGKFGGLRGAINLRKQLLDLSAYAYPSFILVSSYNKTFSENDEKNIDDILFEFFYFVKKLKF